MCKWYISWAVILAGSAIHASSGVCLEISFGQTLPQSGDEIGLWWASSGWKIARNRDLPKAQGDAIVIRAARNESEAGQLVVRPAAALHDLRVAAGPLTGPNGATIGAKHVEVLQVRYVNVTRPTDRSAVAGPWPDPLPSLTGPIDLPADQNHPFWIRVNVPRNVPAGTYTGTIRLSAKDRDDRVAELRVEVYDFALPDRMTCTTAFGFSPGNVFRYQKLTRDKDKREVLDKYWASFSSHHISPYHPAPLDSIEVAWPDIKPPKRKGREVENEKGAVVKGGAVEPPALSEADRSKLRVKLDFAAWDRAMEQAIDGWHFNSFRLSIPGMGGGTFHSRREPQLLGFGEKTPQYQALFTDYCSQMQRHLREKGWLDEAFVYWFDEPDPKDYAFVNNGFAKLKAAAPAINRMLTEQVEPKLVGGPNIWCPVSPRYDQESAERRWAHGEKFWWYICTGPKAPYCTLFIDHPATELRVWLWQTWQRKIEGILVWQTNYWTSSAAYPDRPQNPYEDPMGWRSGYSTPKGQKRPWGNGDGRFIYPPLAAADANPSRPVLDGPTDSIRWEMLRDGIEDYEYLVILRDLIRTNEGRLDDATRTAYTALLEVPKDITQDMTTFTKDPAPIERHRDRVARAIGHLGKLK